MHDSVEAAIFVNGSSVVMQFSFLIPYISSELHFSSHLRDHQEIRDSRSGPGITEITEIFEKSEIPYPAPRSPRFPIHLGDLRDLGVLGYLGGFHDLGGLGYLGDLGGLGYLVISEVLQK